MVSRNYKIFVGFLILLTIVSIVVVLVTVLTKHDEALIVKLPIGKLQGRDNGYYYSYESIPYAEPPVGVLRFEPPTPYKGKWTGTIYDATKPPPMCMQWSQSVEDDNKLLGVEDCLFVSIYKPKNSSRSSYPVIAQIHGGAFMMGGAIEDSEELFMSRGNVIVVKISYRLGPLGFLSAEDSDLPGNYGLKDQRLALLWIKENIAHFGGEPNNILLLGHSAGGASVHLQLLNPEPEPIVKCAASFSGTALSPWVIGREARQNAFKLGTYLGCQTENSVELKTCLRTKSAEEIVSSVARFFVIGYVPTVVFGPVIETQSGDNSFITQHPIDIIKSGKFTQIPWLASYTKEDGIFNAAMFMQRQDDGTDLIEILNERWYDYGPYFLFYQNPSATTEELNKQSDEIKQSYLGDRPFNADSYFDLQRMFTDILFKNGVQNSIELHRNYGSPSVYAYVYDNPSDNGPGQWLSNRTDIMFGTGHGDDFTLIFPNDGRVMRKDEKIISQNFLTMLEGFLEKDSGQLVYDKCPFVNNVGKQQLQLMSITQDACRNLELSAYP